LDLDVSRVREAAEGRIEDQVEEIVRLAEIPAPPFDESRRARHVRALFEEIGLTRPHVDDEGNVRATLNGAAPGPCLLVAAHLDTVFPEDTDLTVSRRDGVLIGPGIGDNAANLGAMLNVARILIATGGIERGRIIFAGTVGEESIGNLRGMRRLMKDLEGEVDAVVCLDGTLGKIVTRAVGSVRFEVRCVGPGGHSLADFGTPSAVHAMARIVTRITDLEVPEEPRTTYNVGEIRGGEGITTIAAAAEMLLEVRSEGRDELAHLADTARRFVAEAAACDELTFTVDELGARPAGATPEDSPLVRTILAVHDALGVTTEMIASSTDANMPMSLGIPAVTFGTYVGHGAHTLDEEVRIEGMDTGLSAAVLVLSRLTAGRDDP
jgi:tripeptide aminopeptidase